MLGKSINAETLYKMTTDLVLLFEGDAGNKEVLLQAQVKKIRETFPGMETVQQRRERINEQRLKKPSKKARQYFG
jgi:uncharacterized protein YheU (UPF0270 family)